MLTVNQVCSTELKKKGVHDYLLTNADNLSPTISLTSSCHLVWIQQWLRSVLASKVFQIYKYIQFVDIANVRCGYSYFTSNSVFPFQSCS